MLRAAPRFHCFKIFFKSFDPFFETRKLCFICAAEGAKLTISVNQFTLQSLDAGKRNAFFINSSNMPIVLTKLKCCAKVLRHRSEMTYASPLRRIAPLTHRQGCDLGEYPFVINACDASFCCAVTQ